MTMRKTDPVVGFNFTVMYQGGPDGQPVIAGAPIRQRDDAGDYVDGTERRVFTSGVRGVEEWIGGLVKREFKDPDRAERLNWRNEPVADRPEPGGD
jgi:hypothetical protein